MKTYEYGRPDAEAILIQPVGDHDLPGMEKEAGFIRSLAGEDFRLIAFRIEDWNRELSPWKAPAVFGHADFGEDAVKTLAEIRETASQSDKRCVIGGYSLAGLFALWAAYQTDAFAGVAAASPSMWFPGWTDYMKSHAIRSGIVYLSLGDREEKTRNPAMACVGKCIRDGHQRLQVSHIDCMLEWNHGNHFRDPELRTAKAFAWVMGRMRANGAQEPKDPS